MPLILRTLITGSVASVLSAISLAILAKREGKGMLQPLNATSHWLHGDHSGYLRRGDLTHTGIGFLTHHASALFWALLFEKALGARARPPKQLLRDGAIMSALAAAVDYGLTPKRLTPGWEIPLSKQSLAMAYVGLALGFAAGALLARGLDERRPRC